MADNATIDDLVKTGNYKRLQETNQLPPSINVQQSLKSIASKGAFISDVIDVIKDYDWTYSKNILRNYNEIPYIKVKEFKILGNSYISSLITSALLFPDIEGGVFQGLGTAIAETFKDNKFKDFMSNITPDIANQLGTQAKNYVSDIKNIVLGADNTASEWRNADLEKNYAYLYLREPTNREYKFPYFDNDYISIANQYSDTYSAEKEGNFLTDSLGSLSELGLKTAKMLNSGKSFTEPGSYIQRPKFYNFDGSNTTKVKVSFYLFNTLNANSYSSNLNLLSKLILQNTPHRFNRLLVDPPCIYELTVPGKGFYPYSHVSLLTVQHIGTKRMINDIIVPDAFKVDIEFTSLTMDVNNFLIPQMGSPIQFDRSDRQRQLNENISNRTGEFLNDVGGTIKKSVTPENSFNSSGGFDVPYMP